MVGKGLTQMSKFAIKGLEAFDEPFPTSCYPNPNPNPNPNLTLVLQCMPKPYPLQVDLDMIGTLYHL